MADQIFLVEDDENIRELVVYALKLPDLKRVDFPAQKSFTKNWIRRSRSSCSWISCFPMKMVSVY